MTAELAPKWDYDQIPAPEQQARGFLLTGTGSLHPGLTPEHSYFGLYPSAASRLIIDTQGGALPFWVPSPHRVLVWRPHDRWQPHCLQALPGAYWGTGSVNALQSSPVPSASDLRVERLARIQASLGFSLQDLAGVLGISRAQLYKWLDPERDIQLQEGSRARLNHIEQFAAHWARVSASPLATLAHEPLASGSDVIALMSATRLNQTAVMGALNQLAARTDASRKSITEEMRERGFRRRPSALSLPSDA